MCDLVWNNRNIKVHPLFSFSACSDFRKPSHMTLRNPLHLSLFSPRGISSVQTGVTQSIFFFFFAAVRVFLDGRFTLEWSSPLSSCQLISGICVLPQRSGGLLAAVFYTALPWIPHQPPAAPHIITWPQRREANGPHLSIPLCLFHVQTQMINLGIFLDFVANTTFVKRKPTNAFWMCFPSIMQPATVVYTHVWFEWKILHHK